MNGLSERLKAGDGVGAGLVIRPSLAEHIEAPHFIYDVRCFDENGVLKWHEHFRNVVTTEGKNDLLTKYFKGSSYTAAWYVGLIDNASFTAVAAGNTAAQITTNAAGSNQWGEATEYDEANRVSLHDKLGTAASGSINNSSTTADFTINATLTLNGAFIASASGKLATSGVLYSAGSFAATRAVVDNDVVKVTATLSV